MVRLAEVAAAAAAAKMVRLVVEAAAAMVWIEMAAVHRVDVWNEKIELSVLFRRQLFSNGKV